MTPHLPRGLDPAGEVGATRALLAELCRSEGIISPVLWYYSPMSLAFSSELKPSLLVYDCMDQLAAFAGAPAAMEHYEQLLLRRADIVFAGGYSLYEAKRRDHPHVHPFPSSVDVAHFRKARQRLAEPADQAAIPHPRIGHYAVLDERLDIELLAALADMRPQWQFVLLGPVVKIDPAHLPRRPNIHYLGSKAYQELPAYLAGWDADLHAVCAERGDPLHQPDQNARSIWRPASPWSRRRSRTSSAPMVSLVSCGSRRRRRTSSPTWKLSSRPTTRAKPGSWKWIGCWRRCRGTGPGPACES